MSPNVKSGLALELAAEYFLPCLGALDLDLELGSCEPQIDREQLGQTIGVVFPHELAPLGLLPELDRPVGRQQLASERRRLAELERDGLGATR